MLEENALEAIRSQSKLEILHSSAEPAAKYKTVIVIAIIVEGW